MNETPVKYRMEGKPKRFEIPYNFDSHLVEILNYLSKSYDSGFCDTLYAPAFHEDYPEILRTINYVDNNHKQMTRETYEAHIKYCQKLLPGKVQILLQQHNFIMPKGTVQYYIDTFGIRKFCCGTFEQAKIIKEIDPTIEITASITMYITEEELEQHPEYQGVFDRIVLPLKFNRDLDGIKKLPRTFEYLIIVNTNCNANCKGVHHWFSPDPLHAYCPGTSSEDKISWGEMANIRPCDLGMFADYISVFKLQDRGWPTFEIIQSLLTYYGNYDYMAGINRSEDLYNTKGRHTEYGEFN